MKLRSQNKYRRLYKPFIFILSIIFTISICSLESLKNPYRADNEATPTTYGSYSTNQYYNGNVGPTGSSTFKPITVFAYSFNGTYNGRFTIYWKYWRSGTAQTNTLQAIELMLPINCYVEAISDSSCTIAFKNQCEIAIILQSVAINDEIEITGVSNYNMTKITDGVASQLDHLNNMIDQLFVNSGTIITRFNTLNQTTSDILTAIQDYFTDNNGTTINIGDIILQFNEFNAQLRLQLGVLNDLNTAIQNIDNKIDTITWTNHTQYNFQKTSTIGGTLSNFVADANLGNTVYVYIPTTIILNNDYLYHFHFPIYTANYTNFNIKAEIYDNLGYKVNGTTYIEVRNSRNVDVYVHPELTSSGRANYIKITCSVLMYGNNYGENSSYYEMLSANDIEYYDLMTYFRNYEYQNNVLNYLNIIASKDYNSKLNDIISAINNISFTIDSDTVNNTEIIIDNYNDIYTDIESIELQFINNFNTQNENIDKTIFNKNVDVTNAKNALETTLGQFMTNDYIKAIIYLFLLTVIIIRILG